MKKGLLCLATIASVIMLPLGVFAAELTSGNGTNATTNSTNGTNATTNSTKTTNSTNTTKTLGGEPAITPSTSESGNNTKTLTFKTDDSTAEYGSIQILFTLGKRIEDFKCVGNDDWTVKQVKNSDGTITCTYSAKSSKKSGTTLSLGTLTYNNTIGKEENDTDEDCKINAALVKATGEINPDTGASLPYIILLGGILIAGAVYTNTNKKTKFNRI